MTALLEPQTDLVCPKCGFEAKVRYLDGSLGCFNCLVSASELRWWKLEDEAFERMLREFRYTPELYAWKQPRQFGKSAHTRFHVNQGIVKIACRYCNPEED